MSGGLDSTTLAIKAIEDGYSILPVNINYGQKNIIEQQAFDNIIEYMTKRFGKRILFPIRIDLNFLTEAMSGWQESRDSGQMRERTGFEFYTPSRNLLFSVVAAHIGEIISIKRNITSLKIGLGVHKHSSDVYSKGDYWDITPEFVNRLNHLFALNDCVSVSVYAPYADQNKSKIVEDVVRLEVPFSFTWTCYDPQEHIIDNGIPGTALVRTIPCLKCEACIERELAGKEAGVDNINEYYQEHMQQV